MTDYDTLEFEVRGHSACVTLNRPEVLNAINDEMIAELAEVYAEIERSQDIWTVIITGAGRALCVGADVNKAADHDMENAAGIDNQGEPILSSMRQWDAPQEAVQKTKDCATIKSLTVRQACLDRQTADHSPQTSSRNMSDAVDDMKREDDLLARKLKGICRGC